jgi:hypothetical protein
VYIDQTVSIGQQARFLRFVAETMTAAAIAGHIIYYFPIEPDIFPDDPVSASKLPRIRVPVIGVRRLRKSAAAFIMQDASSE